MSTIFRKVAKNEDGTFGPTSNNKFYQPVFYHNKTAKKNLNKTKWLIKQNEQYCAFELSDNNNWKCDKKDGYFTIVDNGKVTLGSNEEILGFFPETQNATDAYHGFPVTSSEYEISDKLLLKWKDDNIIDERIHIKLLRCQL